MTDVQQPQHDCDTFDHEWTDHYYGYECAKCGMFIPFGCEPWMPLDDYEPDEYEFDSYYEAKYGYS